MTLTPQLKQEASINEQTSGIENITCIGPGSQLRTAREARRLSVEEVANRLHLTKTMIMDIEEDKYAERLAFTFIRGYLRAYARLVRVSPEAILNAFDQLGLKEHRSEFSLPKMPITTWRAQENVVRWASYGIVIVLLAVVAGVAAWWFYQPPASESGQQDLIKLLGSVSAPEKRTSAGKTSPNLTADTPSISESANTDFNSGTSNSSTTNQGTLIPSPTTESTTPTTSDQSTNPNATLGE